MLISTVSISIIAALAIIIKRHFFPQVATNYVALVIGIIVALIPFTNHLIAEFHSEIFLGMIVAPLLFFEGQQVRLNLVVKTWRTIVSLTVTMVILCAIAATAMVYPLVGSLSVAVILAAISTPTDATASEAVSNGLMIPESVGNNLKFESLFNDASGIILLNMGVLWYVNGGVNVGQTFLDFLYSAGGGVIAGGVIGGASMVIRQALFHSRMNFINNTLNSGTPVKIMYLLTPFAIYYGAEAIHVSGIIAVVCGGLVSRVEAERSRLLNPKVAYDSVQLVNLITDLLNVMVFIILGIVLTRVTLDEEITHGSWDWLIIGILLYLANLVVRFIYVRFVHRTAWKRSMIFALGGIHGTVTFALAYTVAETSVQTKDFNLVIMSESVLIVLSMLVPTILFRFILPHQQTNQSLQDKTIKIRTAMIERAIEKINQIYLPQELRNLIVYDLRSQQSDTSLGEFLKEWVKNVRQPTLPKEERLLLFQAYQLAFREEREYLSEVQQEYADIENIIYNLYQEVMLAQIAVMDNSVVNSHD